MNKIISFTQKEFIKILSKKNKFNAIEELASVFEGHHVCQNMSDLYQALKEREEIMTTGIGMGIAIPHARINSVKKMSLAIGIAKEGIDFYSLDGELVNLIILVAAGEKQHKEYLRLLSRIMVVLKKEGVKKRIINCSDPSEILDILKIEEN